MADLFELSLQLSFVHLKCTLLGGNHIGGLKIGSIPLSLMSFTGLGRLKICIFLLSFNSISKNDLYAYYMSYQLKEMGTCVSTIEA